MTEQTVKGTISVMSHDGFYRVLGSEFETIYFEGDDITQMTSLPTKFIGVDWGLELKAPAKTVKEDLYGESQNRQARRRSKAMHKHKRRFKL